MRKVRLRAAIWGDMVRWAASRASRSTSRRVGGTTLTVSSSSSSPDVSSLARVSPVRESSSLEGAWASTRVRRASSTFASVSASRSGWRASTMVSAVSSCSAPTSSASRSWVRGPTPDGLEGGERLVGRCKAVVNLARRDLGEKIAQRPLDGVRNGQGLGADVGAKDLHGVASRQGPLAGQAFDEHQSPAVQIRGRRKHLALDLFGRHVRGRAREHIFVGHRHVVCVSLLLEDPRDAKVEHHGAATVATRRDHDVGRLQVAVNDALRVRTRERFEHLKHQVFRLFRRQRTLVLQDGFERRALDELEHDVELVFQLPRVDEPHDVGVLELRDELHFALKTRRLHMADGALQPHGLRTQHLHGDDLAGGLLARLIHHTMPSRPDLLEHFVAVIDQTTRLDGACTHWSASWWGKLGHWPSSWRG